MLRGLTIHGGVQMAGPEPFPQARRPGIFVTLGPRMAAFFVVDVILVAVFLLFLAIRVANGPVTSQAAPPSSAAEPESTPEQTAPTAPEVNQELTEFVLPSGNIWCTMKEDSATCTIVEFDYKAPALPQGCTGSVGSVFTVTAADGAAIPCVQTPPATSKGLTVLDYGEASTIGEMTCLSSQNGATCRHNPSGEGFSLARSGYTIL